MSIMHDCVTCPRRRRCATADRGFAVHAFCNSYTPSGTHTETIHHPGLRADTNEPKLVAHASRLAKIRCDVTFNHKCNFSRSLQLRKQDDLLRGGNISPWCTVSRLCVTEHSLTPTCPRWCAPGAPRGYLPQACPREVVCPLWAPRGMPGLRTPWLFTCACAQ